MISIKASQRPREECKEASPISQIINSPVKRLAAEIQSKLESLIRQQATIPISNAEKSSQFLAQCVQTAAKMRKACRINKTNTVLFKLGITITNDGRIYFDFAKSKFGDGTYKKVKLCYDLFNEEMAARLVAKPADTKMTLREIESTKKLKGLGIVEISSSAVYYNKKREQQVAIFQPLYKQSLDQLKNIKQLPTASKEKIALHLLTGLARIAQFGTHRDIKPENILLDDELNACITDFGLYIDHEAEDNQFCGTMEWASPEYLKTQGMVRKQLDVWSMGLVLYSLFFNRQTLPFIGKTVGETRENIEELQPRWQEYLSFKPHHPIAPLIKQMLELDPYQRITAQDALQQAKALNLFQQIS